MDVTRKEEYEIDPNSSFNRLRTLQTNLKEETAFREHVSISKDEVLKTILNDCYKYYNTKLNIHELYDAQKHMRNDNGNCTKCKLSQNCQGELPQCYEPMYKFMFGFRNDNALMLKLINKCEVDKYDDLARMICHFFYDDLFCGNQCADEFVLMLYLLIEQEMDKLDISALCKNFTNDETFSNGKTFIGKVFRNLLRINEVRNYFEATLMKVIIDFENLNNKTNDTNGFVDVDLTSIKNEIIKNKKQSRQLKPSQYMNLITSKITSSNIYTNQQVKDKSLYDTYKDVIDFNIYSNLKDDNENDFTYKSIDSYYEENDQNKQSSKKTKDVPKVSNATSYNIMYQIQLNKSEISTLLDSTNNDTMVHFYRRQLDLIFSNNNNDSMFTINNLISYIQSNKELNDNAEKVILNYKYSFEKIKEYVDCILSSILKHISTVPYVIKCICCIIDKLIAIKVPNAPTLMKNKFICAFFLENLVLNQLEQPFYNGIAPQVVETESKHRKFNAVSKVIKQLIKGELFSSLNKNDLMYIMFNAYLIEVMPCMLDICNGLKQVKLPNVIERMIHMKEQEMNKKGGNVTERNINYNYLSENPNEFVDLKSICFSFYDFMLMFDIVKSNEGEFCADKTNMFYKTFKKITFQEKTVNKKIQSDLNKGITTYMYIADINYNDKVGNSVFSQKGQKFSFQSGIEDMKENANEIFKYERVKYSINTIVKHLNTLTRANFSADSESMENFVKGLNTMIELEGFSEILKEKTIPLDWYGLYLQSNIEGIPRSKSRANYYQLYSDLIEDSKTNYKDIKSDNSLNWVIYKTQISKKNIDIQMNMFQYYQQMLKKYQSIMFFNMNHKIKICLKIEYKGQVPCKIKITIVDALCKSKKNNQHIDVENINQFINEFPNLISNNKDTEILKYQCNNNFQFAIESFFDALKQRIEEKKLLVYDTNDELKFYFSHIQNIIFRKLHYKLYPTTYSEIDVMLHDNCKKYSWIKPENLHRELNGIDEEMLLLASEYVKNLNNEISPYDKVNSFAKTYEIIQSTVKMYEIKSSNAIDMLFVYVFIKSELLGIETNYSYIVLYLTKEQKNWYYDKLISFLGRTITSLEHLSKKKLLGVTEDEECNRNLKAV